MSKRETENSPQTVDSFVVEQVRRCCLLRDIQDTRRRLFIDRKRQFIARVVLGSPLMLKFGVSAKLAHAREPRKTSRLVPSRWRARGQKSIIEFVWNVLAQLLRVIRKILNFVCFALGSSDPSWAMLFWLVIFFGLVLSLKLWQILGEVGFTDRERFHIWGLDLVTEARVSRREDAMLPQVKTIASPTSSFLLRRLPPL